jgi:GTPase SAR1 family protein
MALDFLTRLDPLRRIRCPFCFERFALYQMHLRCNNHYCKTDFGRMVEDPILSQALNGPKWTTGRNAGSNLRSAWWVDPLRDDLRGPRRFLDYVVVPGVLNCRNCRKPTDYRLCPKCHAHLPDPVVELDFGHIAVFGPQSVGKTTFVTVLLHELDHRVGPESGFILDPLTDEIRERYEREYHDLTYGGSQFGIGEDLQGDVYRRSHSATPSIETNRGILQPLVYRLTTRGPRGPKSSTLLSFFDTAGEDWEMNIDLLRGEASYLRQAKGLLFLVDPLRIRAVAHDRRLHLTEKERRVPAADYLSDVRKLGSFFPKTPVKTPIAICLNKLDRWGGLMEPGTALYDLARSVQVDRPDKALDRRVHEEVQSALRRWGATAFLEHVAVAFPNHRFFACSALGDAAQERDDETQPLPTPLLIERPVLWLMEEQGIVKLP